MDDRRRALLTVGIVVVLLAAGFLAWHVLRQPGGTAPDFTVTTTGYNGTLGTPENFTLSEHRGKVVLIDMMAVHCPGCDILAQDVLKPIYNHYGNRSDFVLISVDVWSSDEANQGFGGESDEDIIGFQEKWGFDWPHAQDTDRVFEKYSTVPIPMLVLVDKDGDIVMEKRGQPSHAEVESRVLAALADEAETVSVLRVGLPVMALIAGVASFFAPCSVGLIPAYMGVLLKGSERASQAQRFAVTFRGGLSTAAGIVSLYALVAVGLYLAADTLQPLIVNAVPVIAILLILFGLTMLRSGTWDAIAQRLGMGHIDGRRGFYAFGVGYGLAAFGCTGPIFLPVLLAAFGTSAIMGFTVFAIYAGAIAGFVLLAAGLVASGHTTGLRKILSKTHIINKVAAVLIIAGAFWVWYVHFDATGHWFWD